MTWPKLWEGPLKTKEGSLGKRRVVSLLSMRIIANIVGRSILHLLAHKIPIWMHLKTSLATNDLFIDESILSKALHSLHCSQTYVVHSIIHIMLYYKNANGNIVVLCYTHALSKLGKGASKWIVMIPNKMTPKLIKISQILHTLVTYSHYM